MNIRTISGGVTVARGFRTACCAAGIRYQGRTDMAMIFTDVPCTAAGVFTTNRIKAAPVIWDQERIQAGDPVRAVVINAGIANAGTGKTGLSICRQTAENASNILEIPPKSVLIGSTGVIGPNLPVDRLANGIEIMSKTLSNSQEAGTAASKAIMTTDTVNKETAVAFSLPAADGKNKVTVHLGGMSKGSGMIHPNMSTMLGYLTTDCAIDRDLLQKTLREVAEDTFNMITVDGDTSTNDTLLVLASGLAGNRPITEEDADYATFREALLIVCRDLAMRMAADGEGATHLIETRVIHADTKENARTLARSVVGSSLVKAMIFGKDANCGRVLCALGYAGPAFDPEKLVIDLVGEKDTVCFYREGCVQEFDEELALSILSEHDIHLLCDLNMGEAEATAWGCDLTYDYVKINGDYRS